MGKLWENNYELLVDLRMEKEQTEQWDERLSSLSKYFREPTLRSKGLQTNGKEIETLRSWFNEQKRQMEEGKLKKKQVHRLREAISQEHRNQEIWDDFFERTKSYSEMNDGDANISKEDGKDSKDNKVLFQWAHKQRYEFNKG